MKKNIYLYLYFCSLFRLGDIGGMLFNLVRKTEWGERF